MFGSFLIGRHHLLREFGFGLGVSVLIDVTLLRSLLLPALMHPIGPANWRLPTRLARYLPRLDIDPRSTVSGMSGCQHEAFAQGR
jgi:putative drug exporter of the RND superfamily